LIFHVNALTLREFALIKEKIDESLKIIKENILLEPSQIYWVALPNDKITQIDCLKVGKDLHHEVKPTIGDPK
jgi:hypothetical protein